MVGPLSGLYHHFVPPVCTTQRVISGGEPGHIGSVREKKRVASPRVAIPLKAYPHNLLIYNRSFIFLADSRSQQKPFPHFFPHFSLEEEWARR